MCEKATGRGDREVDVRRCVSLPTARNVELWKGMRWVTANGARRAARARNADMAMVTFWGCGSGLEAEGDKLIESQDERSLCQ